VFQALRIAVNEELSVLARAVPAALDVIGVGGRIVVLAYQSLEDRIVKRELQSRARSTAPAGLPVELPQHRPEFRLLVRGAELADEAEKARNPRSAPVRLRAAERVREAA
jgi:16S rRNA (cytosine1402-N4)-methyltransferase